LKGRWIPNRPSSSGSASCGKPILSVNTYLRCLNAYFRWRHEEHGANLLKIPRLKEEQKAVIQRIEQLQAEGRGNKAVWVNTYLRCLKAFLKWAYEEKLIKES
jgi:hypothetical protein